MKREAVESSAIASIGYEAGVLEVEFENGHVYRYFDVTEAIYEALRNAGSVGAFFNETIRDGYRFEQMR